VWQLFVKLLGATKNSTNKLEAVHDSNFGANVMEWECRAQKAIELLKRHATNLGENPTIADWGCGRQTVRRLIPVAWRYVPYDYILRSYDTRLIDFNKELPKETADAVFCLGLLEYMDDFWGVLAAAIGKGRYCVFSYVGPSDDERRLRNGWKVNLPFKQIEDFLVRLGVEQLGVVEQVDADRIYLVRGRLTLQDSIVEVE
jgi:hypothetical protein